MRRRRAVVAALFLAGAWVFGGTFGVGVAGVALIAWALDGYASRILWPASMLLLAAAIPATIADRSALTRLAGVSHHLLPHRLALAALLAAFLAGMSELGRTARVRGPASVTTGGDRVTD